MRFILFYFLQNRRKKLAGDPFTKSVASHQEPNLSSLAECFPCGRFYVAYHLHRSLQSYVSSSSNVGEKTEIINKAIKPEGT